jgi:hypothetical protein
MIHQILIPANLLRTAYLHPGEKLPEIPNYESGVIPAFRPA